MARLLAIICVIAAAPLLATVEVVSRAEMMARIEGSQSPNRQGLDALTLQQVMDRFRVRATESAKPQATRVRRQTR
jgi:hypothetical protein